MPHVPLAGSEPPPQPREGMVDAPPNLTVRLSVLLKATLRSGDKSLDWRAYVEQQGKELDETHPRDRKYLTLDSLAREFASPDSAVSRLRTFLREFDLHIEETVQIIPAFQHVVITGQVSKVEQAFQVKLFLYLGG